MSDRLQRCQVNLDRRLLDAMWALDRGGVGIALVVDDAGRLVGTVTDGDIRRALLRGATMESAIAPHIHRDYTAVDPGTGRAEVLDLMHARFIHQIPIVSENGRLVGLHLLHELIGSVERRNWAVVMAGGKGTRLWPLTEQLPKPMIRVAGRPILERIVLHLVGHGFANIFLAVNYLGHVIEEHFGDGARFGCRIEYLREQQPLGTGGALSLLPSVPEMPIIVLNGDLVTQADLGALLEFHHTHGFAITLGLRRYSHTVPFGCVELNEHRVQRLTEKPTLEQLVNAGIYALNPAEVARVPHGEEYPLTALVEEAISRGEPVGGYEVLGDWLDVGRHDQLRTAREG
jgi:dTDP-glucose pyrophosphorylase